MPDEHVDETFEQVRADDPFRKSEEFDTAQMLSRSLGKVPEPYAIIVARRVFSERVARESQQATE